MNINQQLALEFNLRPAYADNIVSLIDEGNTIPFIARYRKEMHGGCDDQLLRDFNDRLTYLKNLEKRKEEVKTSIEGQGKWTEELALSLEACKTLTEVEDVYRPYKQKKKTRASVAIEKGLQPFADIILAQTDSRDINEIAAQFIDLEKGVEDQAQAIAGASDIIAESMSDDAELRKALREYLSEEGLVVSSFNAKQEDKEKLGVYEMYKEFSEKIKTLPSHRILALNRGEKEDCLKVGLTVDDEKAIGKIKAKFITGECFGDIIGACAADSYERLIFPSIEREVRNELTEKADEQAIKMFEVNLKPLLMQPPLKGKVILGLDPAYRTGCKIAVIDASGNVLDHTVVYPTPPQNKTEEAKRILNALIVKYGVDVISIGNGTASKESEIFVAELIKECPKRGVAYAVVNEAGASVYSASKLGTEEFPQYDVTVRSAVSIARRLLDPLAELIKIDVKSIGVGQYQHDMPQKRLTDVLTGVVEDCVNSVGVDLNTASYSLLAYVSGLNTSIAKNIVEYRKENKFTSRSQLLKVSKLGPKAYEQCAGFLRLSGGDEALDNTGVHPESYDVAKRLLARYGYTEADVKECKLDGLRAKVDADGIVSVANALGVGEMTLSDIVDEIMKPGRDIRESLPPAVLRADLMDINDLKEGMELTGVVRNVIDFGAFVDIGVHHDGLVHISEISDRYIKHPSEALTVGQTVKVKVIGVDSVKQRINLSIKGASGYVSERATEVTRKQKQENAAARGGNKDFKRNGNQGAKKKQDNLNEMLLALQNKYKRK